MNFISKHAFTLGLVSLGLMVGCASQPKPVAVSAPPPPPAVVAVATPAAPVTPAPVESTDPAVHVTGDNWSFTCPTKSWTSADVSGREGLLALVKDDSEQRRIVFVGQPFAGPAEVFPLMILSGAKEHGAEVTATKQVVINDVSYTYADTTTAGGVNIILWVTVKDGTGYVFMCGGAVADDLATTCGTIATTLKIK